MISWGQIFYGAALSTAVAAAVLMLVMRERRLRVLVAALSAAFLGALAWNAILHRAVTEPNGFFVDIPFKLFPVSWQDTGSGVFTLALASVLLALVIPRAPARRVVGPAALVAAVAFLVDIYFY